MKANKGTFRPVRALVIILLCLGMGLATLAGPAMAETGLRPNRQTDGAPCEAKPVAAETELQPEFPSRPVPSNPTASSSDLLSHRIIATIPLTPGVGLKPSVIASDPHSPLVYIANKGYRDIAVFSGTTALGMIAGLGAEMAEEKLYESAYEIEMEVHPNTGLLYVIESMLSRRSSFEKVFTLQIVRVASDTSEISPIITSTCLLSCWQHHGSTCGIADFTFQPANGYLYLLEYFFEPYPVPPPNFFGYIVAMDGNREIAQIVIPEVIPRSIAADSQRGLVYASAYYTDSVFVLSGTVLFGTVPVSEAGRIEFQPTSSLVYVQSGEGQLAVLSGTSRLAQIQVGEIASMAAHPKNPFLYISHPTTPTVTVVSGTAVLTEIEVISPGRALEVNPMTGLVYLRHPEAPFVTVISGTEVLTQVALLGGNAAIEANPVTGLVYAVDSWNSVAVLEGSRQIGHLQSASPRPMAMERNPVSGQIVLVGSGHSSALSLIQGEEIVATTPLTFTPGQMAIHPFTGLTYLTDLDNNAVQVLSGTTLLASIPLEGVPRDITVQPYNGLVYAPDSTGVLNVLSGTERITIPLSSHSRAHVAADLERGWVYVTKYESYYGDGEMYIVTGTQVVTNVHFDILYPGLIAVEPHSGYVYLGTRNYTWVISGTTVITRVYHDFFPKDMEVAPATGYVYVYISDEYYEGYGEINVIRGTEISSWRLPTRFSSLRAHPQSSYFYAGQGVYGSLVSIGVGPTLVTTMTVGDGSKVRAIAVEPEAGWVYVATDHAIAVLEEYLPYKAYLPLLLKNESGVGQMEVLSYPIRPPYP